MNLLTTHDFETKTGQQKIIAHLHHLETTVHELTHLVHQCLEKERQLESDCSGGMEHG